MVCSGAVHNVYVRCVPAVDSHSRLVKRNRQPTLLLAPVRTAAHFHSALEWSHLQPLRCLRHGIHTYVLRLCRSLLAF